MELIKKYRNKNRRDFYYKTKGCNIKSFYRQKIDEKIENEKWYILLVTENEKPKELVASLIYETKVEDELDNYIEEERSLNS